MSTLLPHLVRESAARFPDRPALVMDGRSLSYAELESLSNRFARSLAGHGVRPGDRVALWLPRSIEGADLRTLAGRPIRTGEHCFGCTAGAGSSCGGAIA